MGTPLSPAEMIDHAKIDAAHERATRDLLLEHARMGRPVCEWRDGQIVTVPPAEIFARYGLDECGNPKPEPKEEPMPLSDDDPLFLAQMEEWREAERWDNEGKFLDYRGEYVIFAAGTIFAHGRNLLKVRTEAEALAVAKGIPPERLVDYFIPGE